MSGDWGSCFVVIIRSTCKWPVIGESRSQGGVEDLGRGEGLGSGFGA